MKRVLSARVSSALRKRGVQSLPPCFRQGQALARTGAAAEILEPLDPRFRGCNPIGLHRPFATNYAIPAQAGTHSAAGWSCPMGHGRRSDQTHVLVEAWVPACAGMARKSNSRIVTMFVEANWVTASFAGMTNNPLSFLKSFQVRPSASLSPSRVGFHRRPMLSSHFRITAIIWRTRRAPSLSVLTAWVPCLGRRSE